MSRYKGKRRKTRRVQPQAVPKSSPSKGRLAVLGVVVLLAGVVGAWLLWSNLSSGASDREFELLRVEVLRSLRHDVQAFTQGLLWHKGKLYESTGQYGYSSLRRLNPEDGEVEQRIDPGRKYFAEGLALVGRRLIQLTWREQTAQTFDVDSLKKLGQMSYSGEGWGLCWDGSRLIMSDGSSLLTFRDPETFQSTGRMPVTMHGKPLSQLNELEWAEGRVYANVWQEDFIVRIDPDSGRVTALIDASGLLDERQARAADVLNGIAYNPQSKTFYLTGKYWPEMFEVRFVRR